MFDKATSKTSLTSELSRGFGFVTFQNLTDTMKVLNKKYILAGKEVVSSLTQIECKDALSKNDSNVKVVDDKLRKIFIGGLPQDITEGTVSF